MAYETYPSYYLEISAPLLSFWEQAQAGQDCAIELVRLKDTHTLSYQKLSVERGKPYAQFLRCEQNVDGTVTASNFERFPVQDWQMTDTGNFYYRLFPAGDKHYADYQLVRTVPPDSSHLAMLEQYVLPIDYYYVNLLITDWSEPDFAGVSFNDLFDRLYALRFRFSAGRVRLCAGREEQVSSGFLPPTLNASSSPISPISAEKLRALAGYDEQTDTYPWRPVRTNDMELYDYPAVEPYITDVRENPDGTMTLLLSCLSTDIPTDCIFSHELTVRALSSGGFEYVSNRVTYPDRASASRTPRRAFPPNRRFPKPGLAAVRAICYDRQNEQKKDGTSMHYGFIKACAVSPSLRVADCPYNAQMTIEAMQRAAQSGCQLAVFPELGAHGLHLRRSFLAAAFAEGGGVCAALRF